MSSTVASRGVSNVQFTITLSLRSLRAESGTTSILMALKIPRRARRVSFNYDWQASRSSSHTLTPFKLTYTNLLNTTQVFDSITNANPAIALAAPRATRLTSQLSPQSRRL